MSPTLRLGSALLISACVATLGTILAAAVALLLALLLLALAWPPEKGWKHRLMLINGFIAFIWLVTPFSGGPPMLGRLGPLQISRPGLELALLVSLKANAVFLIFSVLAANMPASRLGSALAGLGLPEKLVHIFLLGMRFWPVLGAECQRMRDAARLRCFRPRTSRHSYHTLASMLGMLLLRAAWRAQRLREAMLLRCYQGMLCQRHAPAIRRPDAIFCLWAAMCLGLLLSLDLAWAAHV